MATYNGHQEDSEGNILLPTPHSYAPLELGTTASQAYTKGKLMVYNNRLCQATTSIAQGATLTIGTNIAYTDMDTQLGNLRVYVGGSDSKLHFVDHTGADTALNFNPIQTGGTYQATTRGSQLDMGQRNTYRYVNTNNVPNNNTQTKTITTRGTSIDLGGATHDYRYVDTSGIPNKEVSKSLWTNPADMNPFAAQTITLSESMLNYRFLAISYYSTSGEHELEIGGQFWIDTTVFDSYTEGNLTNAIPTIGTKSYIREVYYVSPTQIKFSIGKRIGASGTSTSVVIPASVYAIMQ